MLVDWLPFSLKITSIFRDVNFIIYHATIEVNLMYTNHASILYISNNSRSKFIYRIFYYMYIRAHTLIDNNNLFYNYL